MKSTEMEEHLNELLAYVDYKALDINYVKWLIKNEKFISDRQDIIDDINKAIADRRLLLLGGYDNSKYVVKYCPYTREVTACSHPPYPCDRSAITRCGNMVVAAGGVSSSMALIQIYDVTSDKWVVSTATLKTPRYGASSVFINNKLYVIGGYDGSKCLSSVEIFDVKDGDCHPSSPTNPMQLHKARSDFAAVVREEDIYVLGGFGDTVDKKAVNRLSSCEVINTNTSKRYDIPPMQDGRSSLAAVLFNNDIIAIGGWGNNSKRHRLASVESYSCVTKTWTSLAPVTTPRAGHCAHLFDGKLFVIGGNFPNSVECYDVTPATYLSRWIAFMLNSKPSWSVHQEINIPSYRSTAVKA